MDADGQFERDPVLDHADAELGSLLDLVYVPHGHVGGPVADQVDRPECHGNQCEGVEHEDREVLVLPLLDKYRVNVAQSQCHQNKVRSDQKVVCRYVNDFLLLIPAPVLGLFLEVPREKCHLIFYVKFKRIIINLQLYLEILMK